MDKPKFVYVTLINTTAEKLWAALTKPEFTRQYWFGTSPQSDWKVGSPARFDVDGKPLLEGTVLKSEPPHLLAYTWRDVANEELKNEKPSRVTFEIEPCEDKDGQPAPIGVKLTVTHEDFPPNSKMFPRISNGWPTVLSSLKSLLETGKALEVQSACKTKGKSLETADQH
jgi:uncharacterized protein YndB with AHSA1/START domain